jgi:hypothetical protein
VALAPAEVHALQHLRPVGRLGAARSRADGQDRVLGVVLAAEQEQRAFARELGSQRVRLARKVGFCVGVGRVGQEVQQLLERRGALLERAPQGDLVAQALGLADDLLRGALVVPEPGLDRAGVKLGDAGFLGS